MRASNCRIKFLLLCLCTYSVLYFILFLVYLNFAQAEDDISVSIRLPHAIRSGDVLEVKRLLNAMGTHRTIYNGNRNLLHFAAKSEDEEIILMIKDFVQDINLQDLHGQAPIHVASFYNNKKAVRIILDAGGLPDLKTKKSITPLHIAAKEGFSDIVKILVEKGANIDSSDQYGIQPIHEAAMKGHSTIVKILVENGADINSPGIDGNTPLHLAVFYENLEMIGELLALGANANLMNGNGRIPANVAMAYAKKNRLEIFDLLRPVEKRQGEFRSTSNSTTLGIKAKREGSEKIKNSQDLSIRENEMLRGLVRTVLESVFSGYSSSLEYQIVSVRTHPKENTKLAEEIYGGGVIFCTKNAGFSTGEVRLRAENNVSRIAISIPNYNKGMIINDYFIELNPMPLERGEIFQLVLIPLSVKVRDF